MNYKKSIESVQAIQKELDAIEQPNGHERDALTRCVTLARSLRQAAAAREDSSKAIKAAVTEAETALKAGR